MIDRDLLYQNSLHAIALELSMLPKATAPLSKRLYEQLLEAGEAILSVIADKLDRQLAYEQTVASLGSNEVSDKYLLTAKESLLNSIKLKELSFQLKCTDAYTQIIRHNTDYQILCQ